MRINSSAPAALLLTPLVLGVLLLASNAHADICDGVPNCQNGQSSGDPKCPTVPNTQHNFCGGGTVQVCIQTWEERCADNSHYYCTDDLTVTWCIRCSG